MRASPGSAAQAVDEVFTPHRYCWRIRYGESAVSGIASVLSAIPAIDAPKLLLGPDRRIRQQYPHRCCWRIRLSAAVGVDQVARQASREGRVAARGRWANQAASRA